MLDRKTKELIALAIGVATHRDECIGCHIITLVELNASKQEIEEALGMVVYMGGGPSLMYASDTVLAYEQVSELAISAIAYIKRECKPSYFIVLSYKQRKSYCCQV